MTLLLVQIHMFRFTCSNVANITIDKMFSPVFSDQGLMTQANLAVGCVYSLYEYMD